MAKFAELSKYKGVIIDRLLESQDICKAIYYGETNFLDQPDVEELGSLLYTKIQPYSFFPDVNTEKSTLITINFKRFRTTSNSFKSGYIYISVFAHKELFETDYGTTRVDYLLNKIDEKLNKVRGIGLGELELYEMDEMAVNTNYSGAFLCYKPVDFN